MNKWECDHPGCDVVAIGTGGAVGLRAIGWWFQPGPRLYCPAHRPDPMPCRDNPENAGKPCSRCAGEAEAYRHQEIIRENLGMPPRPRPLVV